MTSGILGGLIGAGQLIGGILTKKGDRPEYQIPDAIKTQAEQATMESQSARRQGRGVADQLIARQASTALEQVKSASSSSSQVAMGALAAQQNANQAYTQQDVIDQQDLQQRIAMRSRAMGLLASGQEQEQQYNVLTPYAERSAAKSALMGAGIQNIYSAAKEKDKMMMSLLQMGMGGGLSGASGGGGLISGGTVNSGVTSGGGVVGGFARGG